MIVRMDVAGQRHEQIFESPAANDSTTLVWNGKDAYGRVVDESVNARVSIGYQYAPTYATSSGRIAWGNSAASTGTLLGPAGERRAAGRISWSHRNVRLGVPRPQTTALGGWTIDPHHFYDMKGRGALYMGDGSIQLGVARPRVISAFALDSVLSQPPTECSTTRTHVSLDPSDVAVGPDGSVYIADLGTHSIYKVEPGGLVLCRIAGTGVAGTYVDNVDATTTPLPQSVPVDSGGQMALSTS